MSNLKSIGEFEDFILKRLNLPPREIPAEARPFVEHSLSLPTGDLKIKTKKRIDNQKLQSLLEEFYNDFQIKYAGDGFFTVAESDEGLATVTFTNMSGTLSEMILISVTPMAALLEKFFIV